MKNITLLLLFLLGLYWLAYHAGAPLSHESLGLYNHTVHRIIGVALLAIGAFLTWKWKFKK